MKKIFLALIAFALANSASVAQEIVLSMDPAVDTTEETKGPNLKNYSHMFMGFGLCVDPGEVGGKNVIPHLNQFNYGFRYKRRLAEHFALGWELGYSLNDFLLKQDSNKTTPDSLNYSRQRLIFHNAQAGVYMRFNFGRRGNTLGNYLDLGGYGDVVFSHVQFQKYKLADGAVVRARITQLDYFQRLNYGVQARIGMKKIMLYGQYRLSDIFYPSKQMAEMPRITAGIQFVLN